MIIALPILSAAVGAAFYKVFQRRADEDGEDDDTVVAFVFENETGSLSASIPCVSYLDRNETDAGHIAMALTDAMKITSNLVVKYMCSDAVKEEIESTIDKICLMFTNVHERSGLRDPES